MSSLLFIDCEESILPEYLRNVGVPISVYGDKFENGKALFLKHSDPIEAIVAGAEWHVLVVHIKMETMNSMEVVKGFNKRIISRATTKVVIFSDRRMALQPNSNTTRGILLDMNSPRSTERASSGRHSPDKFDSDSKEEKEGK